MKILNHPSEYQLQVFAIVAFLAWDSFIGVWMILEYLLFERRVKRYKSFINDLDECKKPMCFWSGFV